MPRTPRLMLPGVPLHITQRGVNKGIIFLNDEDRHHFRCLLREALQSGNITLHAFVLMDNHVHLLVTARSTLGLSCAMRRLGQCYVQYFNLRHRRCGPLWQGRFKSCLVQSEEYLLKAMRYIELNPVRAAMVQRAENHRWSSVHTHLALGQDPLVSPHPAYLALGSDPAERGLAYRAWLEAGIPAEELAQLRSYAQQERALGDERFQRMVEITLGRRGKVQARGRPRRMTDPAGSA